MRWSDRVLLVALCRGAALHYLDGRNGVKDLDVWAFYARHPDGDFPARWRVMADFGPSELGRHPDDAGYRGRHVDLIGRSIDATSDAEPVRAVRRYLRMAGTTSARALAAKAVVALDPPGLLGITVWRAPQRDGATSAAAMGTSGRCCRHRRDASLCSGSVAQP
jgi:hypothetical protein